MTFCNHATDVKDPVSKLLSQTFKSIDIKIEPQDPKKYSPALFTSIAVISESNLMVEKSYRLL